MVSKDVDYVDSLSHKHKTERLDRHALHGKIVTMDRDLRDSDGGLNCLRQNGHEGDPVAMLIVQNAMRMASSVATEVDRLDCQWTGIDGIDPLLQLLGSQSIEKAGEELLALVQSLADLSASEHTLNECPAPAKVYGDLHGQFRDLLLFLFHYGFPSTSGHHFIFNGDWVDRGKHQVETATLVYALKLAFPDRVWLNRGNHEDPYQNRHMKEQGFEQACIKRLGTAYGPAVFEAFADSFSYLPLGTLVGENILVVHGGIGDGNWELSHFDEVERPIDHEALGRDKIIYNILWSDPVDEDQRDSFGVHDSPRDGHRRIVMNFGADVTQAFCEHNDLGMIIRSHEAKAGGDGYEVMHDEHLMRVFSARDYGDGGMRNDGSILSISRASGKLMVMPQMLRSVTKKR